MRSLLMALSFFSASILFGGESENVFMWKVEDADAQVYLLGSIHVADESLYPLDRAIEQAFTGADRIAVEVDIDAVDPERVMDLFKQEAKLPEGTFLFDLLSSDTFFALDEALYEYRMHLLQENDMAPWYFIWLLTGLMTDGGDYEAEHGIDLHLIRRAKEVGKPVISLESVELQMRAFSSFDLDTQIELLEQSVDQETTATGSLDSMFSYWELGDYEGLENFALNQSIQGGSDRAREAFVENLLTDRNHLMAEKVAGFLEQGGQTLVVVGALHLFGGEGVIEILEAEGYEFHQVKAKGRDD